MIQSGVIEMVLLLSDHDLICCSRKALLLKLNQHCKISIRPMTNYSDKIFVEQLRTTKYSDYPSYYQKFVRRLLPIINFVVLIRTLGVKFNTKP